MATIIGSAAGQATSSVRRAAQRKLTGALVVFVQKGTPQRVAAKLMNVDYHDTLLRAAQEELTRRRRSK